jgi:hypothetical protein
MRADEFYSFLPSYFLSGDLQPHNDAISVFTTVTELAEMTVRDTLLKL